MKCVIGIAGAGHAGISAARSAIEHGASRVILFSSESVLPYFRPRLPALAFRQAEVQDIVMYPEKWFEEQNIELRLSSSVTRINPNTMEIYYDGGVEKVDGIVIATGARPFVPPALEPLPSGVTPLWDFQHATFIRNNMDKGKHLVIIGGGLIGVESALRARDAGLSVTLVERSKQMMAGLLCNKAGKVVERIMLARGIDIMFKTTVAGIQRNKNKKIELNLNNGKVIESDMVIIVAGARPNFVLAQSAGIATDNGVLVKNTLETSHYRIFACGDVASSGPKFRGSATIASEQGTIAGANVCSSILGLPLQYYTPRPVQVFMKYGNFEIRCGGVVPSENDEIEILTEEEEKFRALFKKGKEIVGIQMVGTSDEFGRYFKSLKNPE